jgi:hypothetical protein
MLVDYKPVLFRWRCEEIQSGAFCAEDRTPASNAGSPTRFLARLAPD